MPKQTERAARLWRFFNASRAAIWVVVIPLSYFFGWIYSIAFVAICSLYANAASDTAAWRSDVNPNQEQLDRIEEKLDAVLRDHLRDGK
jgi:hypothetical protein